MIYTKYLPVIHILNHSKSTSYGEGKVVDKKVKKDDMEVKVWSKRLCDSLKFLLCLFLLQFNFFLSYNWWCSENITGSSDKNKPKRLLSLLLLVQKGLNMTVLKRWIKISSGGSSFCSLIIYPVYTCVLVGKNKCWQYSWWSCNF